ncbi:DUF3606 domain-containing protein [Chromohalobacter canadensis]|uniref:DUF3606 domain-containing protein n=1 Tax=Chromohalobacter canadensis TaxID=141389 RepID=A0ABZ0YBT2_9GAMM|nr:DUF3606 domain-containing protein [Chromohalobacter canadensis]MCK0769210.1 DUF3606 domain-containing protein [Chromohalobacter canadensis]WQH09495.1 DUF3606 domain-containing protein [Chromohalobacter canadensis]
MSDNLYHRGSPDTEKVNLGQAHEVQYWTQRFGVSEAKLREAVDAVGVLVKDIEAYLKK